MAATDTKNQTRERRQPARKRDPEIDALYERVADGIRRVRMNMGASQREASAAVFGRNLQGDWSMWERGITLPNLATLFQIARWGGVSLAGLGLFEPEAQITGAELARARSLVSELGELLAK